MDLNPVATWVFKPWLSSSSTEWAQTRWMLAAMRASVSSIRILFDRRPRIYTDSLGRDIFSRMGLDAELVVCYDSIYSSEIDHKFWVYPKLLTYSDQSQPYFHFDLDLIVLRSWPKWMWGSDLGVAAFERDILPGSVYLDHCNYPIELPQIFHRYDLKKFRYPNVGFIYQCNMEFNKRYADEALGMIRANTNLDFSNDIFRGKVLNCVFEQQLLGLMIRESQVRVCSFLQDQVLCMDNGFFEHYVGNCKVLPMYIKRLAKWSCDVDLELAQELDRLRNK